MQCCHPCLLHSDVLPTDPGCLFPFSQAATLKETTMRTTNPTTRRTTALDLIGRWLFVYMTRTGLILRCNDSPRW